MRAHLPKEMLVMSVIVAIEERPPVACKEMLVMSVIVAIEERPRCGVERKPGPKEDSATVALIVSELGVPKRTAFRRLQLKDQFLLIDPVLISPV